MDPSMELKVSMEEPMNRSLHLRKSVPDTQQGFKWLLVIFLIIMFLMAKCHPTRASQESSDVSSSDPHIKPVTGSTLQDEEWRFYLFCVGGLYGKNLNFKIGSRANCELPAAHSSSNVTCDDKSMAILGSDNCAALITKYKSSMVFLEREGETPVPESKYENFGDQKNATIYALSKITPNPYSTGTLNSNSMKPNDKTEKDNFRNNYLWLIAVAVAVVVVAVVIFIQCYKKKCRSSIISSTEESMELNTEQVTDGIPNGINGYVTHN